MAKSRKKRSGILEVKPGSYVVQVTVAGQRRTRRVQGTVADAEKARAELLLVSGPAVIANKAISYANVLPVRSSSCPTLAEWLSGRYAGWQDRAQSERTRRKLVSPVRYLLASDLHGLRLDQIGTAEINSYVEWRRAVGAITFATRKDGQAYRSRVEEVGSQTINKSLKVLSAALRLAADEGVISRVPKINYLPEDDARPVMPPSEEDYRAFVEAAAHLRPIAPLLPEVIELLGELGLRPGELFHLTWGSVDWSLGEGDNKGAVRVEEQKRTRVVGGTTWKPKNRKWRVVPFTLRAREIFDRLRADAANARPDELVIPNSNGLPYIRLDSGPMKGGSAGVWKRLRELSGVEGVSMRDLRHYFAVQNLMRGVPLQLVSGWMGHSHVEITSKRYGRWSAEAKEQWRWAALRTSPVAEVAQRPRVLRAVEAD